MAAPIVVHFPGSHYRLANSPHSALTTAGLTAVMHEVQDRVWRSTTADPTTLELVQQTIRLTGCTVEQEHGFDRAVVSEKLARGNRLRERVHVPAVVNRITAALLAPAEQLMQRSSIGPGGATSATSLLATASNAIVEDIRTTCDQLSVSRQEFTCDGDSRIRASRVRIGMASTVDGRQEMTTEQTQTASVVTAIHQQITLGESQFAMYTAYAKGWLVGGCVGATMVTLLHKWPAFAHVGVLWLAGLGVLLALASPTDGPGCVLGNASGCQYECIPLAGRSEPERGVFAAHAPTRYLFDIVPSGSGMAQPSLLGMVVGLYATAALNNGYTVQTVEWLEDAFVRAIPLPALGELAGIQFRSDEVLPNPLRIAYTLRQEWVALPSDFLPHGSALPLTAVFDQQTWTSPGATYRFDRTVRATTDAAVAVATLNTSGWEAFMTGQSVEDTRRRVLLARFVLAMFLDLNCSVCVFPDDELITGTPAVANAQNPRSVTVDRARSSSGVLCFTPLHLPSEDLRDALAGGGYLTSLVPGGAGTCQTPDYVAQSALAGRSVLTVLTFGLLLVGLHRMTRAARPPRNVFTSEQ
jgi:hypothetical protein